MKIEILGMGCPKCKKLYEAVQTVVKDQNITAEVVKVEDMDKILEYSVLTTPALVVDGQVKVTGKVPSTDEIKGYLLKK